MKKSVAVWSLLTLLPLTTTSHAGQVIYRETETSIYVELTGERDKISAEQIISKSQVKEQRIAEQPSSSVKAEGETASPPAVVGAAAPVIERKKTASKWKRASIKAKESQNNAQNSQETPEED